MKKLLKSMALAGIVGFALSNATPSMAQGRGNFDPEEFRQRMMERYRERLEVKSDDEWKIIQDRIEKVQTARRELGPAGGGGFGAFGRGGRRGGGGFGGGDGEGRRGRGGFERPAEVAALEQAIESNASAEEIKQKLAKVREARKEREAKLEKAQNELRQVLTVRQEANAVLMGLLD